MFRYAPLIMNFRLVKRETEMAGKTIPAGKFALAMIGSANRDPAQFANAGRFDNTRDPNPHLAFGHGIHFAWAPRCRGWKLESRCRTCSHGRAGSSSRAGNRGSREEALHVHGPARLPIRFEPT